MYLKEIEAYGFKSFADKTIFEFTKDINGIVGPNGSGKSNVVDAVRWVLGEASNKQIRATDTTSVIFSGSKSRKALNSAMVNLVFDNTDRRLPIDFNEVSIKRVLYRSGENEYYLNGSKCRLKDITELLTDCGAAKESFNIIGQGKIDEILSTRPIDRRVIFEEAAGVLKYKKRKEEAIRKLDRTNNNINRVNDIIKELETNLEPLRIQSEAAKKYMDFKDKLTSCDISLIIHDIDTYSNELYANRTKINELTDSITELSKNSTTYDVSILEGKEKLNKLNEEIMELNASILTNTKLMEQTDADIRILRERKKYLKEDDNLSKIDDLKKASLDKNNELKKLDNELNLINEKIKLMEEDIVNNTGLYNAIKQSIDELNNKINDNNRKITNLKYEIAYLEDAINSGSSIPSNIRGLLHNPLFSGVHNVIGALIETDSEYALAVATSLGGASNYLVVDDREIASKMVAYLKDKKLGRATFYPLDVIKPRFIDDETLNKINMEPGYINTVDKVIKYDKLYKNVITNQLGNVILVDNIEHANKISAKIANRYKIVTLDGQVVNVGGSITGGEQIKTTNPIKEKYDLEAKKQQLNQAMNDNQDNLSIISEKEKKLKTYENKISTSAIDKNTLTDELAKKNTLKENLTNDLASIERELKDIETISTNKSDSEESKLLEKYYQIKDEIDKQNSDMDLKNTLRDKLNSNLNEIEELSRNSNLNTQKLEKNLKDLELKNSRLEVKIDTLLNSLTEDYSITYNSAKEKYILEDNPEEVRKTVSKLKDELRDIGIVNLGSIEEYDRINKRYEFLTKQKEDLNNAEDTLLEIIHDMDNIMKEKFESTFNEIRVEFKRVFKELFKGGTADVYMTDPSNILETGIELEATPPGKNLKNVGALSGGERTFTAISLLFAILNIRPVPFCLFDEVEAALDESNVDAFSEYLAKYRGKTQFIIITHKKRTMEYVDTLYGITMQESGVSKRVSVKLGDIKENK